MAEAPPLPAGALSYPRPTLDGMIRSAEAVNRSIRRLVARAGGRPLTAAEQARYVRLLEEWAAAVRAEQRLAA